MKPKVSFFIYLRYINNKGKCRILIWIEFSHINAKKYAKDDSIK